MSRGLTSFRALAFFAIFLFHTLDLGNHKVGIRGGYLGVLAFFVLSGFLLTPILIDMKSSLNKRDFYIHFYGRRAFRIFPLYYSYILTTAISHLSAYPFLAFPGYLLGYIDLSNNCHGLLHILTIFTMLVNISS